MTYREGDANFGELHVGNMLEYMDNSQATGPRLHEEQSVFMVTISFRDHRG